MFWVISKKLKLEIPQCINIAPARAYPKLQGKTPPSPQPLLVKLKKKGGGVQWLQCKLRESTENINKSTKSGGDNKTTFGFLIKSDESSMTYCLGNVKMLLHFSLSFPSDILRQIHRFLNFLKR